MKSSDACPTQVVLIITWGLADGQGVTAQEVQI